MESAEPTATADGQGEGGSASPSRSRRARIGVVLIIIGVITAVLGALWLAAAAADRSDEAEQLDTLSQLEERLATLRADTEARTAEGATLDSETAAVRQNIEATAAEATALDAGIADVAEPIRSLQADVWSLYESMVHVEEAETGIADAIDAAIAAGNERRLETMAAMAARLQSTRVDELAGAVDAMETAAQRLALSLAATGAAFDISEDFARPVEGWQPGFSTNGAAEPKQGGYDITAVDNGFLMWSLSPFVVADATITVTATPVDGPEEGLFSYGLVCRSAQTDFLAGYWFAVDSNGAYQVGHFVPPGDYVDLLPAGRQVYRSDPLALEGIVKPGLATNTIEVVCDGPDLSFSVNGELLWEGSDDSLTHGTVTLAAITYEDVPVTVRFDDLRLTGGGDDAGGGP